MKRHWDILRRWAYYNLLAILVAGACAYGLHVSSDVSKSRVHDRLAQVHMLCSSIEKLSVPLIVFAKTDPDPAEREKYLHLLNAAKCKT